MHFKLKAIKEAKKGNELDRVTHAVNDQEVLTAAKDSMWEWHAEVKVGPAPKGHIAQNIEAVRKNTFWI